MNLSKDTYIIKSNKLANYLTLFISTGTIFCCALPALLVSLGAGAALSSLISIFPQLVMLSTYKIPIFIGAFIMLIVSGIMQYFTRLMPCPSNKSQAAACTQARKVSIFIYFLSVGIFLVGLLFALIIPFFMKV
ncbi:hypothetical protein N9O74_03820 [Methylophilaceae bacterium]|nr:hypothetical protein [Methylophilaceae bacterium]|tara:strand:- start:28947 stop:29348 length:402 start_codon:yes stop_codon:yes gene_type:complete